MVGRIAISGRAARAAAAAALALAAPLIQGSTSKLANLDQRLLAAHNRERDVTGVAALEWDDGLARDAAAWAGQLQASGEFEHSPDAGEDEEPQGENLWMGTASAYSPEEMVELWIAEKKHYRPGVFPAVSRTGNLDDVGHYTQLVWAETGRVGCAVARGRQDDVLVCRYSSAGNVIGERVF
jgi:hypothetical protein